MRTYFNLNNELVLNVLVGNEVKAVTLDDLRNDTLGFCNGEMSVCAACIMEAGAEKDFAHFIEEVLSEYIEYSRIIPESDVFDLVVDFYCNELYFKNKERAEELEKKAIVPVFVHLFDEKGRETDRGKLRHSEDLNIMLQNHVENYGRKGCVRIDNGMRSERFFIDEAYLQKMGI